MFCYPSKEMLGSKMIIFTDILMTITEAMEQATLTALGLYTGKYHTLVFFWISGHWMLPSIPSAVQPSEI